VDGLIKVGFGGTEGRRGGVSVSLLESRTSEWRFTAVGGGGGECLGGGG
jgi:hypothetical protein